MILHSVCKGARLYAAQAAARLATDTESYDRHTVDESVRQNADFHYRSGVRATIQRIADPGCCAWCSGLAGAYDYAQVKRAGNDVWRRHANCGCLILYDPGNGSGKARVDNYARGRKERLHPDAERDKIKTRQQTRQKPKTIQLPDEIIGRSVGAKARNYDILDLATGERFQLAEGSSLQNVQVFAGKGTSTVFRDARKYASRYSGAVEEWQHVKGNGVVSTNDGDRPVELHWVQCSGIGKREMFVKEWLDES